MKQERCPGRPGEVDGALSDPGSRERPVRLARRSKDGSRYSDDGRYYPRAGKVALPAVISSTAIQMPVSERSLEEVKGDGARYSGELIARRGWWPSSSNPSSSGRRVGFPSSRARASLATTRARGVWAGSAKVPGIWLRAKGRDYIKARCLYGYCGRDGRHRRREIQKSSFHMPARRKTRRRVRRRARSVPDRARSGTWLERPWKLVRGALRQSAMTLETMPMPRMASIVSDSDTRERSFGQILSFLAVSSRGVGRAGSVGPAGIRVTADNNVRREVPYSESPPRGLGAAKPLETIERWPRRIDRR